MKGGNGLPSAIESLNTNMKTVIALLYVFIIAIIAALIVTLSNVSGGIQAIALVTVTPILF